MLNVSTYLLRMRLKLRCLILLVDVIRLDLLRHLVLVELLMLLKLLWSRLLQKLGLVAGWLVNDMGHDRLLFLSSLASDSVEHLEQNYFEIL